MGLVVGATNPGAMKKIRDIAKNLPILVPGVGAQGGDIETVISECGFKKGLTIINNSRSILYASEDENFTDASRAKLLKFRDEINRIGEKF